MTNPDFAWDDFIPAVRDGAIVDGADPDHPRPRRVAAHPLLPSRSLRAVQAASVRRRGRTSAPPRRPSTRAPTSRCSASSCAARGRPPRRCSAPSSTISVDAGPIARPATSPLNTPEALAAFEWWGSILRDYGPPGSVNNHWAEVTSIFGQGRAAMRSTTSRSQRLFADPTNPTVAGKVGYAPAPTGPRSDVWRRVPLLRAQC